MDCAIKVAYYPEVSEAGDALYMVEGETITYTEDMKYFFLTLEICYFPVNGLTCIAMGKLAF